MVVAIDLVSAGRDRYIGWVFIRSSSNILSAPSISSGIIAGSSAAFGPFISKLADAAEEMSLKRSECIWSTNCIWRENSSVILVCFSSVCIIKKLWGIFSGKHLQESQVKAQFFHKHAKMKLIRKRDSGWSWRLVMKQVPSLVDYAHARTRERIFWQNVIYSKKRIPGVLEKVCKWLLDEVSRISLGQMI